MTKYRSLSINELKELQKEFIDFLILNGIAAEDWNNILKNDPLAAEKTLDLFSDVVFESVLRKIKFLEYRTPSILNVFQCLEEKIVLVGLSLENTEEGDFTNPDFISSSMLTPPAGLKIFTSDKTYEKPREMELFNMLQSGCVITNEKLFKALCLSLPQE